ncbi:MAG: sigma-70 family RNA polymerase sigma factor [Propionibacteriales bacterium]|nr:sigma-70 family RNA polymerase sigma factor [Propionibacteriales bacterium]
MHEDDADALAVEFEQHRPYLISLAYRLTSSWADAEDAVSDLWPRWQQHGRSVDVPRAWLTTAVSRICLDRLRSASHRREKYVGPWLPEPLVQPIPQESAAPDPLDVVVQDESVRMAFLVVLDQLTPEQRIAVVLHDALDLPFTQVAEILGCSVPAARQHASRGRRRINEAHPPPRSTLAESEKILNRLSEALAAGDADALTELLAPDVVLTSDGAGEVYAARRVLRGREDVMRFLVPLSQRYQSGAEEIPVLVNGELGAQFRVPPGPPKQPRFGVFVASVVDGWITALYAILAPDKLRHVPGSPYAPPPESTRHPS